MVNCDKCGGDNFISKSSKNNWKTYDGKGCCMLCSKECKTCNKLFFKEDYRTDSIAAYYCIPCFKLKYNLR